MTNTTPTVRVITEEMECRIDAATLRRMADVSEMIGHKATIRCDKGFGGRSYDETVDGVEYDASGHYGPAAIIVWLRGEDRQLRRHALCPSCKISVVLDLGVVTA
jgi:hypothetical protein